jgi:hypothetical protein
MSANAGTVTRTSSVVAPVSGRAETILFLLVLLVLVAGTVAYARLRPVASGAPQLLSWQINSFDGLSRVDQAIHSALLPATEEILWFNNLSGQWYDMSSLEEQQIPPFYKDAFWKTNGRVVWKMVLPGATDVTAPPPTPESVYQEPGAPPSPPNAVFAGTLGQGAASYFGSGGRAAQQSSYLVVIGHAHSGVYWINQATIWMHRNPDAPFPKITKTEALVQEGWRQVIPYSGASEVRRLEGAG